MTEPQIIREWIDEACDANQVPELKHRIDFQFNDRFTARLGDARYVRQTKRGILRLSTPLWERASEIDKYETVIHEACHIVVGYRFGFVSPHGEEWQQAMLNCGVKPTRTHCVDRKGLKRKTKKYLVSKCPNQSRCTVGPKKFKSMKDNGTSLQCSKCALIINFHSLEEME